MESDYLKYTKT